jgi:hypothetical protein
MLLMLPVVAEVQLLSSALVWLVAGHIGRDLDLSFALSGLPTFAFGVLHHNLTMEWAKGVAKLSEVIQKVHTSLIEGHQMT